MNNMNPLVSIIVPIYNVEKYLQQCVDSLVEQTYKNLQIILVDDGSKDYSGEICDQYKEFDNRIEVIHKENGGPSSTRKAGMDAVLGQYVMFLDGDDWLDKDAIEQCVIQLEKNAELGCVLFSYVKEMETISVPMHIMNDTQVFVGNEVTNKIHRRLFGLSSEELNHPERMENIVSCCMKLYRVDYAKQGKYFDTSLVGSCEDGLFNIYALQNCRYAMYLDKPFYHYRKREDSLTKSFRPKLIEQWQTLFSIMDSFIKENKLGEQYREALNNRIALSITSIALNELNNPNQKIFGHVKVIRCYLRQDTYRAAVKQIRISNLPKTWKILLMCCKMKWAFFVYCASKMMIKMTKKGKVR